MFRQRKTIKRNSLVLILLLLLCGCASNKNEKASQSSNTGANSSIAFDRQGLYNSLLGPELKKAVVDCFINREIKGIGLIWHRENLYVLAVDTGQSSNVNQPVVYFAASVLSDNNNKPYWNVQLIATDAEEVIKIIASFDKSTKEN